MRTLGITMGAGWVRDIDSLYDFIGYVVVYAPDRFPKEEYLSDDEQMTLERAFEQLRRGILLVEKDFPGANDKRRLTIVLDDALHLYRNGDDVGGAHRLQDFEGLIFRSDGGGDA